MRASGVVARAVPGRIGRAARSGLSAFAAVALLLLASGFAAALPDAGAFAAVAQDVAPYTTALSGRMILGGGLLMLFGILAAVAIGIWRDVIRRATSA